MDCSSGCLGCGDLLFVDAGGAQTCRFLGLGWGLSGGCLVFCG